MVGEMSPDAEYICKACPTAKGCTFIDHDNPLIDTMRACPKDGGPAKWEKVSKS